MITGLEYTEYKLLEITKVAAELMGEAELFAKVGNSHIDLEREGFTRLGKLDTGKLMHISWLYAR